MRYATKRKIEQFAAWLFGVAAVLATILTIIGQFTTITIDNSIDRLITVNNQSIAACWFSYLGITRIDVDPQNPWSVIPVRDDFFLYPRCHIRESMGPRSLRVYTAINIPHWLSLTTSWSVFALFYRFGRKRHDDPLRCHQCGYFLEGLQSGRCPECGELIVVLAHDLQK